VPSAQPVEQQQFVPTAQSTEQPSVPSPRFMDWKKVPVDPDDIWLKVSDSLPENASARNCFSFRWAEHKQNNQELFYSGDKIVEVLKPVGCKEYAFQQEYVEKIDLLYWQGYINMSKKIRPRQLVHLLYHQYGMFGVVIRGAHNSKALINFCTDEKTRGPGTVTYFTPPK
jgi:hypothetical protein